MNNRKIPEFLENNTARPGENLMQVLSFTAEKTMELADANSVLGERVEVDGVTVIPVSKISVGFAGGGADIRNAGKKRSQTPAGAGAKVSVTPMSFLVLKDGSARLVRVEEPDEAAGGGLSSAVELVQRLFKGKPDKDQ